MTSSDTQRLLARFEGNPPASALAISQCEVESNVELPSDYKEFLKKTNGGQGFIGKAYVIFWQVDELLKMNTSYNVAEFWPDLFLFGSDGGGEAFAFDKRSSPMLIVMTPFIGGLDDTVLMGLDFNAFLNTLYSRSLTDILRG